MLGTKDKAEAPANSENLSPGSSSSSSSSSDVMDSPSTSNSSVSAATSSRSLRSSKAVTASPSLSSRIGESPRPPKIISPTSSASANVAEPAQQLKAKKSTNPTIQQHPLFKGRLSHNLSVALTGSSPITQGTERRTAFSSLLQNEDSPAPGSASRAHMPQKDRASWDKNIAINSTRAEGEELDGGHIIRAPSSSKVSFSTTVKTRAVEKYLDSSSPSTRQTKTHPRITNSASSTPSSSRHFPPSSSTSGSGSKRKQFHEYQFPTSGLGKGVSTSKAQQDSFYKKLPATRVPSATYVGVTTAQLHSSFFTKPSNNASAALTSSFSSPGLLENSDSYLISSEGDNQSEPQTPKFISQLTSASSLNSANHNIMLAPPVSSSPATERPAFASKLEAVMKSSRHEKQKLENEKIVMLYLWECVWEQGNILPIKIDNSVVFSDYNTISISSEDATQLLLERKDILRVQSANCHTSYPYSFVMIMLKNQKEYLIALKGNSAQFLMAKLPKLKTAPMDENSYARALQLMNDVKSKPILIPSSSSPLSQPVRRGAVDRLPGGMIGGRGLGGGGCHSFDNRYLYVSYIWEMTASTHRALSLSRAKIHIVEKSIAGGGSLLEITDSEKSVSLCKLSIPLIGILSILHAQDGTDCPYSMIKIILKEGDLNYLICIEGGMLPLLDQLNDEGINILSLDDDDHEHYIELIGQALLRDTPIKGGILKK